METTVGGLICQAKGKPRKDRHFVATIFVDHASGLDFVYTHKTTNVDNAIEAKCAFERFAVSHGVTVHHYHCDNGIFASKAFQKELNWCNQTVSFCGLNTHHQNGIAEQQIQNLTDQARAMLIVASHKNKLVNESFWPFALCHASTLGHLLPREGQEKSPLEIFSQVDVHPKL